LKKAKKGNKEKEKKKREGTSGSESDKLKSDKGDTVSSPEQVSEVETGLHGNDKSSTSPMHTRNDTLNVQELDQKLRTSAQERRPALARSDPKEIQNVGNASETSEDQESIESDSSGPPSPVKQLSLTDMSVSFGSIGSKENSQGTFPEDSLSNSVFSSGVPTPAAREPSPIVSAQAFLNPIVPPTEHQADLAWFGSISRNEAEGKLLGNPAKTFLVRWSDRAKSYVLSYAESPAKVLHIADIQPWGGVICVKKDNGTTQTFQTLKDYIAAMQEQGVVKFPLPNNYDFTPTGLARV